MSKQTINIGASPNDGTGTPLRTSFDYTNQNFTEIYTALGGGVALPGATTQVIFNDGGTNLAGDAGLVYNKTTDALTVAGLVTAGSATITGAATVGTTLGVTGVSTLASAVVTGALAVDTTTLVANAAGYTDLVGVGTATPAYKLHAVVTSGAVAKFGASTAAIARLLVGNTVGDLEVKVNANSDGQITSDAGKYLGLGSNTSNDRVILTTTGNLSITNGNVVMATSGTGIDFSAVTGGTGTATANVLNDYEEGTFVPTLSGGTTQPATLINGTGRYTKIGRVVTVQIYFNGVNTTGYSGLLGITGLPFTNNGSVGSAGTVSFYNLATFTGSPFIVLGVNESFLNCFSNISSSAFANVTHNAGASGNYLTTSITYIVA